LRERALRLGCDRVDDRLGGVRDPSEAVLDRVVAVVVPPGEVEGAVRWVQVVVLRDDVGDALCFDLSSRPLVLVVDVVVEESVCVLVDERSGEVCLVVAVFRFDNRAKRDRVA